MLEAAEALEAAGVSHFDLKLSNWLVTGVGEEADVLLNDFGVGKGYHPWGHGGGAEWAYDDERDLTALRDCWVDALRLGGCW
jgi:hypothetical protein